MVDAIGHLTGGAVNPDAAAGMVGRAELAQEGTHPVDTHAGIWHINALNTWQKPL